MRIHDAGEAARRPGIPAERDDRADAGTAGRQEAGPARMIAVAVEEEEEVEEVHPVREQAEQPEAGTDADTDTEHLIASLPLFTMASALAALPKNSPNCAICHSPFDASAELRLLPACRHAFHTACIDAWLRTNPVCPICCSAVSSPPLPPLPVATTATAAGDQNQEPLGTRANSRSRKSFRVELGSVSNRRSSAAGGDKRRCTYSHGGFFDYRVDEEVEAIVSRVVRPMAARPRTAAAAAPGEALAEAVGSRGWLGEYLDRVAASATSLSSLSGRWSWRWSQGNRRDEPWDTDASRRAEGGEEEPAPVALGRWIFGL
ncbi:E3 ubiquitin-protein ligase ATL4-like [Miscanthus floridulus]|uniref:E3 ubiquitin-protein ligase ATL4-like n=1 Tax=Miscanthus floridulus TaxID=154761 RepID=UPI00345AE56C